MTRTRRRSAASASLNARGAANGAPEPRALKISHQRAPLSQHGASYGGERGGGLPRSGLRKGCDHSAKIIEAGRGPAR
jgi:hypothetical protein